MASRSKLKLTPRHLGDDVTKAANEALNNAVLLCVAGYFEAAREIALAMLAPGPWQVGRKGNLIRTLEDVVPLYCWLCGTESPAVGEEPARNRKELEERARETAQQELEMLLMADRMQNQPAGKGWTEDNLEGLGNDLAGDALWILKARASKLLEMKPSANIVFSLLGRGGGAKIAPEVERISNDRLAQALEANARRLGGVTYMDGQSWTLLAVIALMEGQRELAAQRMRTLVSQGPDLYAIQGLRHWGPWKELQATHGIAPALGIDERAVADYLQAFRARGPLPPRQAKGFSWKAALQAFAKENPGEKVLRKGVPQNDLDALQARLGEALPPSYLEFLRHSNGLELPERTIARLLPANEVDWFKARHADWIAAWTSGSGEMEVPDEQYFTYGPDQDCVWMRSEYLATALQVSDTEDGDVYLLNPKIRFGDEWEAWFFGNKNPGAFRYRSFADLMREQVFEREDE